MAASLTRPWAGLRAPTRTPGSRWCQAATAARSVAVRPAGSAGHRDRPGREHAQAANRSTADDAHEYRCPTSPRWCRPSPCPTAMWCPAAPWSAAPGSRGAADGGRSIVGQFRGRGSAAPGQGPSPAIVARIVSAGPSTRSTPECAGWAPRAAVLLTRPALESVSTIRASSVDMCPIAILSVSAPVAEGRVQAERQAAASMAPPVVAPAAQMPSCLAAGNRRRWHRAQAARRDMSKVAASEACGCPVAVRPGASNDDDNQWRRFSASPYAGSSNPRGRSTIRPSEPW